MLEERGIPATVVITQPFQAVIVSNAAKLGAPGYHAIVVPHPVYGKSPSQLDALARSLAGTALAQLQAVASDGSV
jgi:hypothetical protein